MSETEAIASSIIPYEEVGKKASYLTKRICYFSIREACQLAKVAERTVRRWREEDPSFNELDTTGLIELREQFSTKYLDIEFTRNFHLVLQKDFDILYKDAQNVELTDKEQNYLLKLRSHYTPQSLAMLKQLLGGGNLEQPFDFTKLVVTIRREREQIEIRQEQEG